MVLLTAWIRYESHPSGREVKIQLEDDAHVSDVAAKACELLSFGNARTRKVGEILVKDSSGEELGPRLLVKNVLKADDLFLIGLATEDGGEAEQIDFRAKSWEGILGEVEEEGLPSRATHYTWHAGLGNDENMKDDVIPDDLPFRANSTILIDVTKPSPKKRATFADVLDERIDDAAEVPELTVDAVADDASSQSLTARAQAQPSNPSLSSNPGIELQSSTSSLTLEKQTSGLSGGGSRSGLRPGQHFDTNGDGKIDSLLLDTTGDGMGDTFVPLNAYKDQQSTLTPGGQLAVDTTGDGFPDTIIRDTTGDGCGNVVVRCPNPATLVEKMVLDPPDPASHVGVHASTHMEAVYVDRIPPDASDAMICKTINDHLAPVNTAKVRSLEVIRNQKTRHCHAFAFLDHPPPKSMVTLQLDGTADQFIRVQSSDKDRAVPAVVKPRLTLHMRIYAKRKGWVQHVNKMEWAGLLAILESVEPNITECINIVADDRSKKNLNVHKSVFLCAFFIECKNMQLASFFKARVQDKRTVDSEGVAFLLQCEYTLTDKRLHDTCKKRDQIEKQFASAVKLARECEANKGVAKWPVDAQRFFEFESRRGHDGHRIEEDSDSIDGHHARGGKGRGRMSPQHSPKHRGGPAAHLHASQRSQPNVAGAWGQHQAMKRAVPEPAEAVPSATSPQPEVLGATSLLGMQQQLASMNANLAANISNLQNMNQGLPAAGNAGMVQALPQTVGSPPFAQLTSQMSWPQQTPLLSPFLFQQPIIATADQQAVIGGLNQNAAVVDHLAKPQGMGDIQRQFVPSWPQR